ncbi:MAG: colanic acid biosynthesis glycosyltransferase WcaL [Verrucomicrobia bacterium]|nr:MAG: colanic acid biosynthesis glycosyltransferase WcaL [Verrucomicrobiota bacterium]
MATGLQTSLRTIPMRIRPGIPTTRLNQKGSFSSGSHGDKPLIAFFCATYLKPEMYHIYRQISALSGFSCLVVTQKVQNLNLFPFQPLISLPRSPWRWWSRIKERLLGKNPWQISQKETKQLRKVLEENGASILHIFFGTTAIHMLPVLQSSPIPVVVSFHGADVGCGMLCPSHKEALSTLFERAALVTCRSLDLAGKLRLLGCPPDKIRLQRTVLPDLPFHRHLPPSDGRWKLLQIGRLIPKKGLHTTLQAFALFKQKYPDSSLTIAGQGPLRKELELFSRRLGIASDVHFVGFQSQEVLQRLLLEHSIFLHPSETTRTGDTEGVPNALLEALASGIPCIATQHGGIPEAIENGCDGLLVEEKNPDALAQAMSLLAESPALYERVGRSGAKKVRRDFGKGSSGIAAPYFSLLPK